MTPRVSVIIAAYNGAALIGETIASLKAQTLTEFEVVIVDDCSTDDTRAVLAAIDDPRFRVIEAAANRGPVHSRNRAFAEARGTYIAGLDQDDLCAPTRLAEQAAYLDAHPDTVLVASAADVIEGGRVRAARLPAVTCPALVEWMLWICNPLVWSSVMVRADAARRLAPFTRPDRLYAEDFDLYHRIGALGRVARVDTPLLHYRSHEGGASSRHTAIMLASATQVLAERYAPHFADAEARAKLIATHVMAREPVPDRATLALLGETLAGLQAAFVADRAPQAEALRRIRWETARLWAAIGRAGLRSGALGLADALSVRPDHLGLGYAGLDQLILSRLVGGVRRLSSAKIVVQA
ncbi:glycosyltransferase [Sphingomonas sp.]|uniref:glycosyltransferase family 2 protein n=1 Tax=Sphingomonas sp. TaxID=28214 RepID=UPI001DB89C0E|nr:glycosyltransferase [Sphingomonas sp.]MBX9797191.1 glycosyltransferase [Sphingomonas sp.]